MNRVIGRSGDLVIDDPARFAAGCAWGQFRRWNRELVLRLTDDVRQCISTIALEVTQSQLTEGRDISAFASRRVREFAHDYGFGLANIMNGVDRRADEILVSFDSMPTGDRWDSFEKLADVLTRPHAAAAWQTHSEPPDPEQIDERKITDQVACHARRFRRRLGLSDKRFCRETGFSRATLRHIERGDGTSNLETLFRLSHTLQVSTDSLFDGETREPVILDWSRYWPFFIARLGSLLAVSSPSPTELLRRVTGEGNYLHTVTSRGPEIATLVKLSREMVVWPQYLVKEAR